MEDYKSNSHKAREKESKRAEAPPKKGEKVVSGIAKVQKKSGVQKFAGALVSDDMEKVKSYILEDVIIPALKDTILDIVKAVLGVNGRSDKNRSTTKVQYGSFFDKGNGRRDKRDYRSRDDCGYDNIVFSSRGDAEAVLSTMDDILDQYGIVSVSDLYEAADIDTNNYTLNKIGWTSIRSADIIRVRDGWMIKFPKPAPIDD